MTDLQDLQRAFAELERRADDHLAADLTVRPLRPRAAPRPHRRPLLVGATAAALLVGVATAAVLVTGGGTDRDAAPAGGVSPSSSPTGPGATPSPSAPSASGPSASPGSTSPVATTTADLRDRFTTALGGLATFTVTVDNDPGPNDPNHDVAIVGVLTTPGGASGGYDVQTLEGQTGTAQCASDTPCQVSTLADGSTLAVGTSSILAADGNPGTGVTYEVTVVRPDGVEVLLHVSNQRDPKGLSSQLSAQPPLTTAQAVAVVTSPAWVR